MSMDGESIKLEPCMNAAQSLWCLAMLLVLHVTHDLRTSLALNQSFQLIPTRGFLRATAVSFAF